MKKYLLAVSLFPFSVAVAQLSIVDSMKRQQQIQAGRQFFLNRCSGCHGVNADGQGLAAHMLDPKPRNLVEGAFKFRTTPSGVLPTEADLMRTIEQGVIGTSMPSFADLPLSEKKALVSYLRSLRPEFTETRGEQVPIQIQGPPKEIFSQKSGLIVAAKRGRKHYEQACMACHGNLGAGDGTSADQLTDTDDRPIRPANLRLAHIKGGRTAADVFRAISVGLDGSPMPGFDSLFNEKQRWDIVAYIYYLRGVEAGMYQEKDLLQ